MTEAQKFLLWQYAELVNRIISAGHQPETEELSELIAAMNDEKSRMEDVYYEAYGVRPPPIPPPPPPWWW